MAATVSVVIVGGNCKMHHLYKSCCKDYGCTAKVFTQMKGELKRKIGSPDLLILFTDTVSHKMVECAMCEARRSNACVERIHSSSISALRSILESYCQEARRA